MLKKIPTEHLVTGMYIRRMGGSWLSHPFWRQTFLVRGEAQIGRIRRSGVREVWIDTLRGRDVIETPASDEVVPAEASAVEATRVEAPPAESPTIVDTSGHRSLTDELEAAGRIVAEGRTAMKQMFRDIRLGKAIDAEHCMPLVDEITQSFERNPGAIVSLARLKTTDDYTYLHSVAVCALMISLARQMGLSAEETREAGLAGLVHDCGKAVMPLAILNKPGKLTNAEYAVVRGHAQAGYDMLMSARGVGPAAMAVALHHHEKFDGTGYPHGLKGEAIPLLARMGAVCDVYDAITSNRPYKSGWDPALSIQKMAQWSREGHFDERVMQAFVKSIGIYPVGSLVRLSSERLAVVVDQSPQSLLTPIVKAILHVEGRRPCDPETVDLGELDCRERIVSRELAADWGLASVDDHWRLPPTAID